MELARRSQGRFSITSLLRPQSVAVLGAGCASFRLVSENLRSGGFAGTMEFAEATGDGVHTLAASPDLAVVAAPPADQETVLAALAARGTFAAVMLGEVAVPMASRQDGLRVLGPMSFGVAVPAIGLNASLSHMPIPPGRVALVTQSASLARAVIDWAGPNGIGFSHVVGIGGNADIGFGQVLDWLSRDPGTGLIMMDIRLVRARRAFISAARAASRLRPVVALRPGGTLIDASGRADLVFAAALQRAGVFVVPGLEPFLAAAEVLSRARGLIGEAMAVVTNAIGPGRLAADAALRAGIRLAELPQHAQAALTGTMPAELTQGLIFTGSAGAAITADGSLGKSTTGSILVADIAAMVSAVPEVGGVLVLLAPTGQGDDAAMQALIAASSAVRMPLLSCVMGESSGAAHRSTLAAAGLPAFATPEQAVQGFAHLLRHRRAREAARELPPRHVLEVAPDHAVLRSTLTIARREARLALSGEEAARILAAYGFTAGPAPPEAVALRLTAHDDAMFGPAIGLALHPKGAWAGRSQAWAYDLPPLNLPLATAMASAAGLSDPAEGRAGVAGMAAQALVRVSQLLVDQPELAELVIGRFGVTANAAHAEDLSVTLRPAGERAVLAIPPYPEQLSGEWRCGGECFAIRPIRPEDASAHAALVGRVPREDLRYRFFSALREVAPEQIARLTQIDYEREMAFIAVRGSDGTTAGVARLVREADAAEAEFAVLVEPAAKGHGLGSHLMRRLIDWAARQGIRRIVGQILSENAPMIGFVRHLGFAVHRVPDDPEMMKAVMHLPESARGVPP